MLLVLDNCEHVIEAAAALAVDTLRGAPGVRVLATSRERYAPRANTCTVCHRWRALPQRGSFPLPRLLTSPPIVRGTTNSSLPMRTPRSSLRCEKLDGIPLAIEFAAAREPVAEHNDMVKAI